MSEKIETRFACYHCEREIPIQDVRAAATVVGGFTWEDVDALRKVAADNRYECEKVLGEQEETALLSLTDRIAALLPPREDHKP